MLRSLIRRVTSLRLRNDLRLRLRRHPIELRERYPDLGAVPLRRGAVVFDVGANVGYFSECALAWQPWLELHAFEPIPAACATLEERLSLYGGITVNRTALGATREERDFHVSRFDEASSFLENGELLRRGVYGIDFSVAETIRVRVDTLAHYVREHNIERIDLLKLDVQGFELEVLKGAEPVLDRIEAIYCEAQFRELYRGAPLAPDLFAWLHARGFTLLRMTQFRADDGGQLMECDMLFIARRDRRSHRAAD
ncbi:MAG TPA: FkbM family methyltransferase [Thermoanaerobaculia bacterium]